MQKTFAMTVEDVVETFEGKERGARSLEWAGGVRLTIQDTWPALLDSFRPSRNPWRMTTSQLVIV